MDNRSGYSLLGLNLKVNNVETKMSPVYKSRLQMSDEAYTEHLMNFGLSNEL